jgi:hypothetical protein
MGTLAALHGVSNTNASSGIKCLTVASDGDMPVIGHSVQAERGFVMTKEQVENIQDALRGAQSDDDGDGRRERSTIQFPYNDLDDAVSIAKAVHENAGISCTIDQLAAYVKNSMTSGAFRLRLSNAATFGLTDNERGEVRLTELGRRVADPAQEATARVDSFLAVPLYTRIYDNYKGFTLPGAAALEKFMREVGVSSKQTGKARQAFMRSARQAGFFAHGEDRLVRPAGPGTKPLEGADQKNEKPPKGSKNGSGGGDDLNLDPLLVELLKKIPPAESGWPEAQRLRWFRTFAMNVSQIYDNDTPIELEIKVAKEAAD